MLKTNIENTPLLSRMHAMPAVIRSMWTGFFVTHHEHDTVLLSRLLTDPTIYEFFV